MDVDVGLQRNDRAALWLCYYLHYKEQRYVSAQIAGGVMQCEIGLMWKGAELVWCELWWVCAKWRRGIRENLLLESK